MYHCVAVAVVAVVAVVAIAAIAAIAVAVATKNEDLAKLGVVKWRSRCCCCCCCCVDVVPVRCCVARCLQ